MSGHRITADLLKADTLLLDPGDTGTIRAEDWYKVVELVMAGSGEGRTLADPAKSGQLLLLTCKTHGGGNLDVTCSTVHNIANQSVLRFAAAEESILLFAIPNGTSGYKWSSGSSTTSLGDAPTFA